MAGTGTADKETARDRSPGRDPADEPPVERLKDAGKELLQTMAVRALNGTSGKLKGVTKRLSGSGGDGEGNGPSPNAKMAAAGAKALAQGKSPLKAGVKASGAGAKEAKEKAKEKAKNALSGGGGDGKKDNPKVTNIVEQFDVGLPLRAAYGQWTRFADFPGMTSKLESVEHESDAKVNWRAKIFLSHRSWESTIIEQVPDNRIVWKSKGAKGYVDGAVTFHELAPTMTRILLVAEYHPDGFLEKTANLWRAQGRRLRLEFKHIKRHMMTRTLLERQEVDGWRGEIRDGEVVTSHEDALKKERGGGNDRDERAEET